MKYICKMNNSLIADSIEIFLKKDELDYFNYELIFSRRFKSYNGNIEYKSENNLLKVKLSYDFKRVGKPIKKGIIRILFRKIVKKIPYFKKASLRIKKNFNHLSLEEEIYYNFIKNIGEYTKTNKPQDNKLIESFQRVNHDYFNDLMDKPKLFWSSRLKTTLGYYEYSTDSIKINTKLKSKKDLLDFIMYHELLHKRHKFKNALRKHSHTKEFKKDERKFKNYKEIINHLKKL
ncbi:MAG: SprT-like domain-containing protein [Candidatus Woesearchaeota archaeon]